VSPGAARLREHVRAIRDALVATDDTVCLQRARLVTEAWRTHESDAPPLRRAKAFAHVLRHMDLDVHSNPTFAGNTSSRPRAWMLVPEHGFEGDAQVELEHPDLAHHLDGQIPQDLLDFWRDRSFGGHAGIGHLAVDLEAVVHRGLRALIAEANALVGHGSEAQQTYREAMRLSLQAVIDWAERYAEAAEGAARQEVDPFLREAHLRVARACRHVPAEPARDLFEGLQAIALVQLALAIEGHGMSVSVGLPDRVLAPFIGDDFDPDEGTALAAAFVVKVAGNSLLGRGYKSLTITVGGADAQGRDGSNPLTLCFLDAAEFLRLGDPPVFVRWDEGLNPAVKRRAAELLASGLSMPLLVNDGPTIAGFVGAGVAAKDAAEYCVIGCNELGIPGRSMESATALAGTVQYLELLNEVLLQLPDPDAIGGMSELLQTLEQHMLNRAGRFRAHGEAHRLRLAEERPTPFTSALMRGCLERGEDLLVGMPFRLPGVYERGLTNAANALAAIEHTVFLGRTLRLSELVGALREDFADGAVREQLLAAPKWGNDDDRADRWAVELVAMRERVLTEIDERFGGHPHMSCHVVRSLHHLDGRRLGASADGRRAGAPLADSLGAQTGTARAGPTGVLNSVLKLDAAHNFRGGYNLNLTLPRADSEVVLPLIETFFGAGGQELQISVLDAATLRAAQADPERHGDLVVRIAGFSGRFVDLSRTEQDELIERAEAAHVG
jgi:formate C-acetyltransferase